MDSMNGISLPVTIKFGIMESPCHNGGTCSGWYFDFYIFQVHLPNDWVEIVSVNLVGNIVLITNYNFYLNSHGYLPLPWHPQNAQLWCLLCLWV